MGRFDRARSLETTLPAVPAAVGQARAAVTRVAAANGADEQQLDRLRLAVSEAVSNAVVHAYEDASDGTIDVTAAVIDGELSVVVADDGCGLGSAGESLGLGLGLGLIAQACDSLTFTPRASGGLQVEMRFRLVADAEPQPVAAGRVQDPHRRGSFASATAPA